MKRFIAVLVLIAVLVTVLPIHAEAADYSDYSAVTFDELVDGFKSIPENLKEFWWDNGIKLAWDTLFGGSGDDEPPLAKMEQDLVGHIFDTYGATQFGGKGYIIPINLGLGRLSTLANFSELEYQGASYPGWTIWGATYTSSASISDGEAVVRDALGEPNRTVAQIPPQSYVTLIREVYDLISGQVVTGASSPIISTSLDGVPYVGQRTYTANAMTVRLWFGDLGMWTGRSLPAGAVVKARYAARAALYVEPVGFSLNNVTSSDVRIGNHDISYGTTNGSGTVTTVNDNRIFNEENNTFYNPTTNETHNVTDWNYDYSTRTYTISIGNGDTYTVEYGDTNITITNVTNNETHNYYYVTNITVNGDNNQVIVGDDNDNNSNGDGQGSGGSNPPIIIPGDGGGSGSNDDDGFSLWDLISGGISGFIKGIAKISSAILDGITTVVTSIVEFISNVVGNFISSLLQILGDIINFIVNSVLNLIRAVLNVITGFFNGIITNVMRFLSIFDVEKGPLRSFFFAGDAYWDYYGADLDDGSGNNVRGNGYGGFGSLDGEPSGDGGRPDDAGGGESGGGGGRP